MKKQEFVETVKTFMEDYNGFDWENGTIVLVANNRPFIMKKYDAWWTVTMEKHENDKLLSWTHDYETMVMVV